MIVRFLGTGTSTGVPQIGCDCEVCRSTDIHDKRLRSSVLIEKDNRYILIDCSPDFREQVMHLPFNKIDAVLITHEHYDHVGGLDDLRPFSTFGSINIYAEQNVVDAITVRMPYCFTGKKINGLPDLSLKTITTSPFLLGDTRIIPIRVMHGKLPILGYRIDDFAYLCDLKYLPDSELDKLRGVDLLIINALRIEPEHPTHQTLEQALELINTIKPQRVYLTHMSHQIGLHSVVSKQLPKNVHFAYDGLTLNV